MKTYYQILIIIFVLLSFIIIKDDIRVVLDKKIKVDKSSVTNLSKDSSYQKKEEPLKTQMDNPGALKIVDIFNKNNNTILSASNIISLTNKFRIENKSGGILTEQNKLNKSAEKKMQDMFDNQYFEHISPSGLSVGDLSEQAGYEYILIGENLAMGNFKDDSSLVDAWMASKGHRENILNKNYTEIGVAVGQGIFDGKNIWIAVSHFGTPQNICPEIDRVLLGIIDLNQNKITEISQELSIRREKISQNVIYEGNTINEQIEIYNNLVNYYNNLINQTKNDTDSYNDQVKSFNNCLLKYQ